MSCGGFCAFVESGTQQFRGSFFADRRRDDLNDPSKLPTGQTQPITGILPNPKNVLVKDVTNALNLAQKGLYKELQSIEPGGSWEESFWIRPRGF